MKFRTLKSRAVALLHDDIDTDQIIPAQFLTCVDRAGLVQGLFQTYRQDPTSPLHEPAAKDAKILIAGENFGCGSSREHAVWALRQWGFRAIIAPSFGDIFRTNALKNGLLAVACSPKFIVALAASKHRICIDLQAQSVALSADAKEHFDIDPFARRCLMNGEDELGYLLGHEAVITNWEGANQ
ncbi:3-isopropylmalate dehydratase small subunit [Planctomycetota bacterium]|nr:3-isopropylmalate dehydratase small subunit [Planctomycetota bacterium]